MMLKGFEDLQPKDVLRWNNDGTIQVKDGESTMTLRLVVNPNGGIGARHIPPVPIDQQVEQVRVPVAQRWAGVDQVGAL